MNTPKERPLNYVYFIILFICLSFLHVYQVFLIEDGSFLQRTFYMIYALAQCTLEIGALLLVAGYLVRRFPKSLNPVFIAFTFLLFLIHLVDFPLIRIMDMSIWYGLDFISGESFENFIEMLYASNVSLKTWMLLGVLVIVFALLSILFFRITHAIAARRPLNFSYKPIALTLCGMMVFLSIFDFRAFNIEGPKQETRFLKALPWKTTFFFNAHPIMRIKNSLKKMPKDKDLLVKLTSFSRSVDKKPNLFIFIIESLRDDFIVPEVAPCISQFKKEGISVPLSLSSANATHLSWFSIFQSRHSFYWDKMQPQKWHEGSLPLHLLKKMGYQIHVYSSAALSYYKMDEVLFGKEKKMATSIEGFLHDSHQEPYERDAICFEKLQQDMNKWAGEEGHIFITFLDGTHFDYSYPQTQAALFTPIVEKIDYFKVIYSKEDLEAIKNRYRNAIFYIDGLFGSFYRNLKQLSMGKEAVVVLTGDHGEEFFEQGYIFHASNLSKMQTQVPIYYRFGENGSAPIHPSVRISSHIDIFPTLLHYVCQEDLVDTLFEGESIFREKKRNFSISTRYNASRAPFEFAIHNGKEKMVARFTNEKNIYKAEGLQILSKRDKTDDSVSFELESLEKEFKEALDYLFN